jgi:dTDP-4-amino-4,6-dideoxygalactose transaminase
MTSHLKDNGIPTAVYYPKPLHCQTAYSEFPREPLSLSASEKASMAVFSLPMHPYLSEAEQDEICATISGFFQAHS